MASKAFSAPGLRLSLEEGAEESVVYCSGKITAESAETFQSEIRDHVIPMTRGKGVAVTTRIVLDLSNVSFVDSAGLGSLFGLWEAAQAKACNLEIVNLSPRLEKLVSLTRLDRFFSRVRGLFSRSTITK
jgi:anti-sigma B factor antagonist